MRILLVAPGGREDLLASVMREIPYLDSPAFFAPHALAAVAAVTPAEHEVRIHDENLRGPVDGLISRESFDILGVTLTTNQLHRASEILELARGSGAHRVIGGIGAGAMLPVLQSKADTLFLGEVEDTWPRFLGDFQAGRPLPVYQTLVRPEMARTPAPRWDLLGNDLARYGAVSVQTARGCPFDCDFCDVLFTYGRKVRQKPLERVLQEVALLERRGAKMVLFADDCFAADRAYVKDLLRRLAPLNNSFRVPLGFLTQVDLTVADDEELLELMADANFQEVQIGVESTHPASLEDLGKRQNLRRDPIEAVRRIQSYGISVMAHWIVGTDADDGTAFQRLRDFLREARITHHHAHPLIAPPGTRLWYRLRRQGRIVTFTDEMRDRLDVATNVIPLRMTRLELMEGLAAHWESQEDPDFALERILGFLHEVRRMPRVREARLASLWRDRGVMAKATAWYTWKAPRSFRKVFFATLDETRRHAPSLMPRMMFVVTSWVMDVLRSRKAARMARLQADFERAHPEAVRPLPRETPIAASLRDHGPQVVGEAWNRLRPAARDLEHLTWGIVEALTDFNDRFGTSLTSFDEAAQDALRLACDRAAGRMASRASAATAAPGSLPPTMPGGFPRDVLDALERTLQVTRGSDDVAAP
ncbi:MAG TPA: B12-binding domain-containing radical SAM protein [Myxococcota bacterium]|nr:B12-binding domain-containing radical SAM protein [Myxococcota bacterium]HQK51939.1 B12-binding domain-containing radical SAM protein [Myxococcota bacterium]